MNVESILPVEQELWGGVDWQLGAHPRPDGTTFAVHAPLATRVQLEFYTSATGTDAAASFLLAKGPDGTWRAKFTGVGLGDLYAFRAWGVNWNPHPEWMPGSEAGFVADMDEHGNRFNPNKVLFDPYAYEITHNMYSDVIADEGMDNGIFGTGGDDYRGRPRRQWDTGRYAPKGVVMADTTPLVAKPRIEGKESAIYEVQVEQFTGHPSVSRLSEILADEPGYGDVVDIPDQLRGTYKGAGMMAPYLKALGFTTIELLPVHETNVSESGRAGLTNQWGYMTLSYFAPSRRFSSDRSVGGPTREFKEMVNAFHECGLEVYLDVVYNHSAEGGNWNGDVDTVGFTTLGGFAASDYYVMTGDKMLVDGATGTSNQLNFSSDAAQQLVLDSLAYWSRVMGVDGFRFDLATVLGRKPEEADPDDWQHQKRFFNDHPLLTGIAKWARKEHVEVIAEAWDLWGYEVGNFPRGWGEWNGRYRDAVRRFTKGDGNTLSFLDMLNGDHHHFHDNDGAQKTINFIDAHDGFTMADLVSYQEKVNDQPYPFGPSDGGTDDNLSWDSGGSRGLRRQRVRNLWTLLFFSRGVPMVVAGDEFGRTQNGNNNPWALDSVAMTNNYAMINKSTPHRVMISPHVAGEYHDNFGRFYNAPNVNGLFRFATFVSNLRRRHESLRQESYGDLIPDNQDVSYLFHTPNLQGHPVDGDRALSVHINSPDDDFWLMINMASEPVEFDVPEAQDGRVWRLLIDTATWAEPAHNFWPEGEGMVVRHGVTVEPWSIVVWHDNPTTEDLLAPGAEGQ